MSQQKVYNNCEQFVLSVYKTLSDKPSKLQTFTNLFSRNKKSNIKTIETQSKLAELLKDHPELIDQLNRLLPDNLRILNPNLQVSSARQQEEEAKEINKIFMELQKRRPDKVQEMIELIKSIKSNQSSKNIDSLKEKLSKVLVDEPTLLKMFMNAFRSEFDKGTVNGYAEADQKGGESSDEPAMEFDENEEIRVSNRAVRGAPGARSYVRRGGKGRRGGARRVEVDGGSPPSAPSITLPVTVKNELNLFENLRGTLSKGNYGQLMKIIYLYTECVIGANEAYQMVKPLLKGNDSYLHLFHEMLFAREKRRRQNTEWFKPLSDIDFESKRYWID